MGSVPWWLWLAGALVLFVLFTRAAMRAYRRGLADRFAAHLRARHPTIAIVGWDDRVLTLKLASAGEATVGIGNLGARVRTEQRNGGVSNEEAERVAFEALAQSLEDADDRAHPTLDKHGAQIRPRLVNAALLDQLRSRGAIVSRPLDGTPLHVAYVFDTPSSVQYILESDREKLGIDATALHDLALRNLRPTLPEATVRRVIDEGTVTGVRFGDTYDAARLLLLPEQLRDGEAIVALVPERDGMILAPVPADEDWSKVQKVARQSTGSPTLFDRPILVTRAGFIAK